MIDDLEAVLAPHVRLGETLLDVVRRLIFERNGFAESAAKNHAMVEALVAERVNVAAALNDAGSPRERSCADGQGAKPRSIVEQVEVLCNETKALRAAIADNERTESEGPDVGCGDASCVVAPPKGQATNGRCRCGPHKLRMVVKALRKRIRILEIAPHAAHHACNSTGDRFGARAVEAAALVVQGNKAFGEWEQYVLQYVAGEEWLK